MAPIDLEKLMPPMPRMFGGNGEVIPYGQLESSSDVFPSGERAMRIDWAARGVGFGQAYLGDEEADTETMSRTFIATLLNRFIQDAAWSNEGYRDEVETVAGLQVRLANSADKVGFQYMCSAGTGVVYIGRGLRNHGEVSYVDISASPLKSQDAVRQIIFTWLEQIQTWN